MLSFRQRLARDEGFTLIELLVVLIIIGVLLAIAIPSYLGFQKKAQQTAAAADVRQAIPDAVAYYSDNNSYTGVSIVTLQGYDSGMHGLQRRPARGSRHRHRQGRRDEVLHLREGRGQLRARRRSRRHGGHERDHGLLLQLGRVVTQTAP